MEEKTLNQLKTQLRQLKAPKVIKSVLEHKTMLDVVYEDRVEHYELVRSDTYKSIKEEGGYESYDRYDEERIIKENGGREIHYKKDD